MKRLSWLISIVLAIMLLSTCVYAQEIAVEDEWVSTQEMVIEVINPDENEVTPQGTSKPGIFAETVDLSEGNYSGSFSGVVYSIYTDVKFYSNSSGIVYLKIRPNQPCKITLIDYDDGSESPYSVSVPDGNDYKYVHWSGMDPTHKYYFKFENEAYYASVNTMNGSFAISHNTFR